MNKLSKNQAFLVSIYSTLLYLALLIVTIFFFETVDPLKVKGLTGSYGGCGFNCGWAPVLNYLLPFSALFIIVVLSSTLFVSKGKKLQTFILTVLFIIGSTFLLGMMYSFIVNTFLAY